MNPQDNTTNLQELKDLVVQFRQERDWDKHFTPKDVATSIAIEAAELLEHYQWANLINDDPHEVADELADVLIYAFHFATLTNIDIATAFRAKLAAAAKKYPVEKFNDKTDNAADYHRIKREYREGK